MTAPGIYAAKTVRPFESGACWVVIPQLFGDVQVEVRKFAGQVLPLLNERGWVMFEGGVEEIPVWVNSDTSVSIPLRHSVTLGTVYAELAEATGQAFNPPNLLPILKSQAYNLFGADTTAGTLDWNNIGSTRPGVVPTLLAGNATNGPGGPGYYFHVVNFEFDTKDGSGNLTQLAIPYASPNTEAIWMRGRYLGTWSAWRPVGSGARNFALSSNWDSPTLAGDALYIGSVTATFDANRKYRATVHCDQGWYTGADNGTAVGALFLIGIRYDGVGQSNVPVQINSPDGYYLHPMTFFVQFNGTIAAGSHTIDTYAQRVAGNGYLQYRARLSVEDMGPA